MNVDLSQRKRNVHWICQQISLSLIIWPMKDTIPIQRIRKLFICLCVVHKVHSNHSIDIQHVLICLSCFMTCLTYKIHGNTFVKKLRQTKITIFEVDYTSLVVWFFDIYFLNSCISFSICPSERAGGNIYSDAVHEIQTKPTTTIYNVFGIFHSAWRSLGNSEF